MSVSRESLPLKKVKIAVLLSGGVDSSVALALMCDWAKVYAPESTEIHAYYLKIWLEDDLHYLGECPWEEDLGYATAVCERLQVPLYTLSLQSDYWSLVVEDSLDQLKLGLTPSPDILCNQKVKFGRFLDKVGLGYDFVVSGHYAWAGKTKALIFPMQNQEELSAEEIVNHATEQIQTRISTPLSPHSAVKLFLAPDPIKDQTYFLCHLSSAQLSRCLFPLGTLSKSLVRRLANHYKLETAERKDSQGICFLGKFSFNDFVRHHLGIREGNIVDVNTGNILGKHEGYWFHTIGQRKGLGLSGGPWFVIAKDTAENIIFVSHSEQKSDYVFTDFEIKSFNWLAPSSIPRVDSEEFSAKFKVRHGPQFIAGLVTIVSPTHFKVKLSRPDQGLASGQYAVMYDEKGDECYGGGVMIVKSMLKT